MNKTDDFLNPGKEYSVLAFWFLSGTLEDRELKRLSVPVWRKQRKRVFIHGCMMNMPGPVEQPGVPLNMDIRSLPEFWRREKPIWQRGFTAG